MLNAHLAAPVGDFGLSFYDDDDDDDDDDDNNNIY